MTGKNVGSGSSDHLVNGDPNKLIGPHGYGPSRFISATQTLTYKINFRNERKADIPVQKVVITEQLDPSLDWTTFQLGDFTIAGTTYTVPPNDGFYRTRLDLTSTLGIYLDVTAGIDLTTGVVTWTFTSIDPTTGDLPTSFFIGFLPPDQNPPAGEASVTYRIRPYPDDPTGTVSNAQAAIVFDTNDPVPTKVVANTIDAAPPSSTVAPLPAIKHRANFVVRWSGSDDPGGSGIAFYDIYVATDDGPFVLWLAGTTATSAVFPGAFGHRYSFYSVATDNVGNQEPMPDGAQAMTDVEPRDWGVVDGPGQGYGQDNSFRGSDAASVESALPDGTSTGVVSVADVEIDAVALSLAAPSGTSDETRLAAGDGPEVVESDGRILEALREALMWEVSRQPVQVETPSACEMLPHRFGLSEQPGWDDLAWPVVDAVFQDAAGQ